MLAVTNASSDENGKIQFKNYIVIGVLAWLATMNRSSWGLDSNSVAVNFVIILWMSALCI